MNTLTFPEGITYKYRYVTGGDYTPIDIKFTQIGNLYRYANNTIIDFFTNMSNINSLKHAFSYCGSLTTIPQLDTSNVTDMSYMFDHCTSLIFVSQLDTSNVTNMNGMFYYCSNLTSIPQLDTSNVTNMNSMLYYCQKLTTIPQLDCSKVTDIGLFGYSGNSSIVNLGGFKNLGMQKSLSNTTGNYFLGYANKLTHESIMNVINNLYDRASAGYTVLTLKLHANTLALLSDEEKAIATNKGWTLS